MNVWVRRPKKAVKENGTPEGRPEEAAGFAAHGAGTNAAGVDLTGWEGKALQTVPVGGIFLGRHGGKITEDAVEAPQAFEIRFSGRFLWMDSSVWVRR